MAIIKTVSRVSRVERESSPGSRDSVSSYEDEQQRRSSESESDNNGDEVDDVDSAAGSDDFDLSELGEIGEEFCQVGDQKCSIPFDLYDLSGLGEILSVDTWNNCLTEEERYNLAKYLPDMEEITFMRTLKELFSSGNFHFGSPLVKLFDMLKGGLCEPRVSLYQQGLNFIQKREYYHHLWKYQNSMVSRLIQIRDAWENCTGYNIGMKLRVLNKKRSQKSLMPEKMEDLGSETNSSGREESDDGFWNKRLKDVQPKSKMGRQAVYARTSDVSSHGRAVAVEPVKFGQKNPKGILKVAGVNVPSIKEVTSHTPSIQHGLGAKSRPYGSSLSVPQKDRGTGFDLGNIQQTRNKSRAEDDVGKPAREMIAKGNWNSTHGSAVSKVGLLKQGRKHEFLKSEDHSGASFKGSPFSLKNDNILSHGTNTNLNQMADIEVLAEPQNGDGNSYGYNRNFGKKGKHVDKHQCSAFGDQMSTGKDRAQHLLLKDIKVDWTEGSQSTHRKKTQENIPRDQQVGFDEWNVGSKKRKMRQELRTGKSSMGPMSKGNAHTTVPPWMRDTFLQPPDYIARISEEDVRKKSARSRGLDMEGLRGMSMFAQSEETESDSSEQVDEEEEIKPLGSMFGHPSGIFGGRQSASIKSVSDTKKSNNLERKVKKEYAFDRVSQSSKKVNDFGERPMPELAVYSSKGKQKGKIRDLSYLPNLAYDDMQHYQRTVKSGHMQGESGERMHLPFSNVYPAERKRRGRDDDRYSVPQSKYMHDYISEDDNTPINRLHATPKLVDDRAPLNRLGKKGKTNEAHAIDRHDRPNMSLLGCKASTKKGKGKEDTSYLDELDESDYYMLSSPLEEINDPSLKKHGKTSPAVPTSETPASERGLADLVPEAKPMKKPFTLITPTVHSGFSFSIIHLLSAVRMAMITPLAEDTLEVSKHLEKSNEQHNPMSEEQSKKHGANGDAGISGNVEQKNLPSLTIQEIVSRVRSNPGDPFILETQEPLQDLVRGVLKIFLSRTAPLGAKGWKALVSYERTTKSWTWIGPVSSNLTDTNTVGEEISSDAWLLPHKMLVKLVDSFANWLKSGQETLQQIGSLPAPPVTLMQPILDEKERFRDLRAQKSLTTISPSSEEVRAYFRKEEILRYLVPDRAFSYTAADGRKSIVAPLRRCGGKPNSKARDHYMLKPDRPPHVTVLCLVRDAAARLPGSIGTRADVCTLIRDSQYIVEDVSDAQINQVVSGALDRLHYERDPCVQFDGERKLWVYLHREREEEDFEDDGTASTKKWKRQRKDVTDLSDLSTVNVAYYGTEEHVAGSSAAGFDLSTDLNAEPSPMHEDEGAEPVYNGLKSKVEDTKPFSGSAQGSMHQGGPVGWKNLLGSNPPQENKMLCQENSTNEGYDGETYNREMSVGLLSARLS